MQAEARATEGVNEEAEEGAIKGVNQAREHLKGVVSYIRQQDTYLINKYGPTARVGLARYVSTHMYAATK